ncbi:MAG: peptidoglycan recognition family protein [Elusimicrobiales bacterium]|nr:peptidoglycan recognition family protein [Elusimicrobiales bacterium]
MRKTFLTAALFFFAVCSHAGELGESLDFNGKGSYMSKALSASAGPGLIHETGQSAAPEKSYDTIVLNGILPDKGVIAQVQTAPDKWEAMHLETYDGGRFWGKYSFAEPRREKVSLRFYSSAAASTGTLKIYDVETFLSTEPAEEEAAAAQPRSALSAAPPAIPGITLVTRAQWNANAPTSAYSPQTPNMITVHHTAAHFAMTKEEGLREIKFLQDFHQKTKGWADIAYHFIIDGAGNVYQGRPVNVMGAHVKGRNTDNAGISLMGNFMETGPTDAQLAALKKTIQGVAKVYNVKTSKFYAHREIGSSDCPGNILYAKFQNMRKELQRGPDSELASLFSSPRNRTLESLDTLQSIQSGTAIW